MSRHSLHSVLLVSASVAAGVVCLPRALGQEAAFDAAEARTALKAALAQNEALQERLASEKAANDAMAVKVGILSAEASAAREELEQLKLRSEAVGSTGDLRGLEQRVLDAVNDLRLARAEYAGLEQRFQQLVEAATALLHGPAENSPSLRTDLEQALIAAQPPAPDADVSLSSVRIESSRIVSVKPEQRLLVVNAGRTAGMKPGTPLRIYRNDRPLASAVVVEVRASLSGSLITQLEGDDFPQVGDTLRLLSESN
jgi:hypothetical protein